MSTQAAILSADPVSGLEVALDHAEQTGEHSRELRQRIADVLPSLTRLAPSLAVRISRLVPVLQIASAWHIDKDGDWVRDPLTQLGAAFVAWVRTGMLDALEPSDRPWHWSACRERRVPWDENELADRAYARGKAQTEEEAKRLADETLIANGWVLCPQPKTESP